MIVLKIIGALIGMLLLVVLFACLTFTLKYISWFHWRTCKYCGHTMEYKGLKEDNSNGHYLFHCSNPKCGAWEEVPKEEFFRSCDNDMNPNNNMTLA